MAKSLDKLLTIGLRHMSTPFVMSARNAASCEASAKKTEADWAAIERKYVK